MELAGQRERRIRVQSEGFLVSALLLFAASPLCESVVQQVSHWWGTRFQVYCLALQRHAKAVCETLDPAVWGATSYWICGKLSVQS